MLKNDFLKVACVTPVLEVGNPLYNVKEILKALDNNKASIVLFPEQCLSAYTCGDLFFQKGLLDDVNEALKYFLDNNTFDKIVILGGPVCLNGSIINAAFVIKGGEILGVVPKKILPNTREFFDMRYYKSGNDITCDTICILGNDYPFGDLIFTDRDNSISFGIEICADMWASVTPGNILSQNGANIIFNLSASNELLGKKEVRKSVILENSRRNVGAYVYANAGIWESTSDGVFSGHSVIASCGSLLNEGNYYSLETSIIYADIDLGEINYRRRMSTNLHRNESICYTEILFNLPKSKEYIFENKFDMTPFVPKDEKSFSEIRNIIEYSLIKRLLHLKTKKVIIGVSGGLDSALVVLVALSAFKKLNYDPKEIIGISMPSLPSSKRTKDNASKLCQKLGITFHVKPIDELLELNLLTIKSDKELKTVTYENAQARIRTMILMNMANEEQGIVLGTGDMSEIALGWCTYGGDILSMYGINAGLPKTLVRYMVSGYAKSCFNEVGEILEDIIKTPISPELLVDQKTEDYLGKYEVNDFILARLLTAGDDSNRIKYLLSETFTLDEKESSEYVVRFFKRFYSQQFKRQTLPDGPKVLEFSLNPRTDLRLPSDIKRQA